jgi:hypothetical protein
MADLPEYSDPMGVRISADMAVYRILIARLWTWLASTAPDPHGLLQIELRKMTDLVMHDDVITTDPPEYDDAARERAVAKIRHVIKLAEDLLPLEG